jgi:hypothetical protein
MGILCGVYQNAHQKDGGLARIAGALLSATGPPRLLM